MCLHLEGKNTSVVASMDHRVAKAIEQFVEDGIGSVKSMKTMLDYCVRNEIFKDSKLLDVPVLPRRM